MGRKVGPRMGDLSRLLEVDYRLNGRKSLHRAMQAMAHLSQAIDEIPLRRFHEAATTYVLARLEVAAPATVRYELAIFRRGMGLAVRAGLIHHTPQFPTITVQNARSGFFERDQLAALVKALPDPVNDMATFAGITGWRISEVRGLTWEHVDAATGTIRLEPGTTKNREGRVFPYSAHEGLARVLAHRRRCRRGPWVFHRDGKQVRYIATAWNTACRRLGLSGRVFHDLRRSAVRDMERAGVPRSVQMRLVGLKTESIHNRYAISNEADLARGVSLLNHDTGANGQEGRQSRVGWIEGSRTL